MDETLLKLQAYNRAVSAYCIAINAKKTNIASRLNEGQKYGLFTPYQVTKFGLGEDWDYSEY